MNLALTETYVACLTPSGVGAIATLAVRGPQAWTVMCDLFRPRSPLPAQPMIGPIWLGRLGAELADEAVLSVKQIQPVPWVEVHCHGGREVIRLLLEAFSASGVRLCSWQEFETLTNPDPVDAQAAHALANAFTFRVAAVLLDQQQGAFRRAVQAIVSALEQADTTTVTRALEELQRRTNVGRRLTTPWRVVIAGAPNVGKSSLVNALAGYQR